jgi:6-pyruvoyltetrahydropterin/6-carboxytetrahydropterin synthase
MYTLAVRRDFISRHYLVGGDGGSENLPNSHHYDFELQLQSPQLNQHGYLADIAEISKYLDELVSYFGEKLLNDLPEFKDLNPSMENFSRILAVSLARRIQSANITCLKVRLSRDDNYWASYELDPTAPRST